MAITYVGGQVGGRAGSTSTSNVTFALTGGTNTTPQPGDLVIIGCTVASQNRTPACGISGYTAQTQINANGTTYDTSLNMSHKFMGTTPDTTFTLPSTGNIADAQRYTVQVWRGVDSDSPFDATPVPASGTATGRPNPGSITPTSSGAYVGIIGAGAAGTGASYTAPANYTTGFLTGSTADTNDAMIGSGYRSWTSGAEDPAQYTGGTTNAVDSWAAFTYALKPSTFVMGVVSSSAAVNLTSLGATDWAHWETASVTPGQRKSGGGSLIAATNVGGSSPTLYTNDLRTVSWTDGTPTASGSDTSGIYSTANLVDGGFNVTFPADTTPRTAKLYTNSWDGNWKILATLSDGAKIPVGLTNSVGANASGTFVVTVNYVADSAGQTLTLTVTLGNSNGNGSNVTIQAAHVTGPAGGAYTLTAQGGSYTLSGGSGILKRSKLITASGGSYTLTGQQAVLTWAPNLNNYVLTALGGSYSLTGSSAQVSRNRKLTSSGGSYTLLGASAILRRNRLITALGGSYTQTGSSATISRNRKLTAQGGNYSLTGSPANIFRNRVLTSQGGSYILSGQDIVITWTGPATAYNLICQGGSYSLTGSSVNICRNRTLSTTGGVYTSTGSSATISKSKVIVAQGGSYSLSGQSITLSRNRLLVVNGGSYSITGNTATITWATAGGAVWPSPSLVLLGTVYGPTGSEYTGTLDLFGIKYDITTGQLVKPINDKVVMTL